MKLVCPACGAAASAEAYENDAVCRQVLSLVCKMPGSVNKVALGYLSLFRPGKRSLSWKKAFRLAIEVDSLVSAGYVHVAGRVDRDCNPYIWARAMEQMIEQRSFLTLPMANHKYLEKVAWDMANQADANNEKKKNNESPRRPHSSNQSPVDLEVYDPQKIKEEYNRRMKIDENNPCLHGLSNVIKGID